ncbi:MAG: hypothetical protein JWO08_3626 [Verrucomicrobiaceae bacterium]|nr:hypothetical protein [Verrucomicrobiaceae bacterium]
MNAPNITLSKRFPDLASVFLLAITFSRADKKNSIRQVYEIAELSKAANEATRCPQFMRLRVTSPPVGNSEETADFRDEILAHLHRTDDQPREIKFVIEVADEGEVKGFPDKKLEVSGKGWQELGTLTFTEAVASHNGDFVIHFPHSKWRNDVNDPATEAGIEPKFKTLNKILVKLNGVLRSIFGIRNEP